MADDKTFAARMDAAKSMTPTIEAAEPVATPPKAAAGKPSESSTTTDTDESGDGSDVSEQTDVQKPEKSKPDTEGDDRVAAIGAALEKGDLKALQKALGDKVKIPESFKSGLVALSKGRDKHAAKVKRDLGAISKAKSELTEESVRVSNLIRHGEQKYGWVARGEQAWDNDDLVGFAKAVEKMAKGASLATITQKLAGAGTPKTPEDKELAEQRATMRKEREAWEAEKAAEKAKAEKAAGAQTTAQKRETAMTKVGATLKSHPFMVNPDKPGEPDPEALEEVFAAYEKSWENGRFTKTVKEIADGLHAREIRKAKRLGIVPAAPPVVTRKPTTRLPVPPPTPGKAVNHDETRAARIAAALRMSEQQRRGAR